METITRNVKDIGHEDRLALEHVIGKALTEDQQLLIQVIDATESNSTNAKTADGFPAWLNVYEGLDDETIDRLDQAVRRNYSTRVFE
jgi:hypothetical protein